MTKYGLSLVMALALLVALAFLLRGAGETPAPPRPRIAPIVVPAPPASEPRVAAPASEPVSFPTPRPAADTSSIVRPRPRTGAVYGTVKLLGKIPRRRFLRITADPKCAALHRHPMPDDSLMVNQEGGVRWAFVHVVKGPIETSYAPPPHSVVLDQVKCRFVPHVLGVMVGQDLLIRNSDNILHNVHALPFGNREFSIGQPQQGAVRVRKFTEKEVMVKVKCDIHPWMSAWVGVVEHPFFDVTSEAGGYTIKDLPPGEYELAVWHEKFAAERVKVTVAAGMESRADPVLQARKR